MQEQKINVIQSLAHSIDSRLNLFDGYSPKKTDSYKGEVLFWRQVVTLYGLFADCSRVQIKEKKNLFELMNRYALIDRTDYDLARKFWNDVSEVRKWFCHNNDMSLYYARNRENKIKNYLSTAFSVSSNKPERIEDIQLKDWNLLTSDFERRFQSFLDILEKGLLAWKVSNDSDNLLTEWLTMFSASLFVNKELIQNVLIELAVFEKRNQNIRNMSDVQLANSYYKQLELNGFSAQHIEAELKRENVRRRTNKEIIMDCIRNSQLIQ